MKKILLLLSVAITLFTSCEVEDPYKFVDVYTINTNRWELINGVDQLNSYYQAEIRIPELDRGVYEKGTVSCYMFQKIDGVEVQTPLPFSLPKGIDNGNGTEDLWTETYAYDFAVGSIMFYVNYSDFWTGDHRPPTISFRVVLRH